MNTALSSVRAAVKPRRTIFIPLGLLAASLAVAGFWPSYFGPLIRGISHAEWIIHLHAFVFVGWIVLVMWQAWLASTRRIALHVFVGRIGMIYGVVIVLSGLGLALYLFARAVPVNIDAAMRVPVLAALTDMLAFGFFLGGAWFTRRRPELHKRFILLTVNVIIVAGVSRLMGGMRSIAPGDVASMLLVWLSPLWIAMLYDWFRNRIVHPVYLLGAAVMIAMRYRHLIRQSDEWNAFLRWLAGRFA